MITSVHIENFKCFKQFDIDLGTFNVLVGPNGSGKTAFMRVIQMACALGRNPVATLGSLVEGGLEMDADLAWQNRLDSDVIIRICANAGEKDMEGLCGVIHVDLHRQGQPEFGLEAVTRTVAESPEVAKGWLARRVNTSNPAGLAVKWARAALGGCKYYRLDPAELRQPSGPSGQSFSMTARGTGFPTYLMDILRHDREAFFDVEKAFYARFPEYRRVELPEMIGDSGPQTRIRFAGENDIGFSAESVSDGVMLFLAYRAICANPEPPHILLIEEPENGVHHASLKEIVAALRELADRKQIQVIATTHSPFLLDWVEVEDVRVFAKGDDSAVRCAKLSDYPEVEKWKKHFMSGEIWTGLDEADVVAHNGGAK